MSDNKGFNKKMFRLVFGIKLNIMSVKDSILIVFV